MKTRKPFSVAASHRPPFAYARPGAKPQGDHRELALMHVQRRAWERLGLALTKADVEKLTAQVSAGKFGDVARTDREGRQHFAAKLRGHDVRLIYCPRLDIIVTLFQRPIGTKRGDPR